MPDVYQTSKVAVEVTAMLDKAGFSNIDAFVDSFAERLQKKVDASSSRMKKAIDGAISRIKTSDSVGESVAERILSETELQELESRLKKLQQDYDDVSRSFLAKDEKETRLKQIRDEMKSTQKEIDAISKESRRKSEADAKAVAKAEAEKTRAREKAEKDRARIEDSAQKAQDGKSYAERVRSMSDVEVAAEKLANKEQELAEAQANGTDTARQRQKILRLTEEYNKQKEALDALIKKQEEANETLSYEELLAEGKKGVAYDDTQSPFVGGGKELEAVRQVYGETVGGVTKSLEELRTEFNETFNELTNPKSTTRAVKELKDLENASFSIYRLRQLTGQESLYEDKWEKLTNAARKRRAEIERTTAAMQKQAEAEKDAEYKKQADDDWMRVANENRAKAQDELLRGTENLEPDYKKAFQSVANVRSELANTKAEMQAGIESAKEWARQFGGSMDKPGRDALRLREKIVAVVSEMERLAGTTVDTKEWNRVHREYVNTMNYLAALEERQDNMLEKGAAPSSKAFRNLQIDIENATKSLVSYREQLEGIRKTDVGGGARTKVDTERYADLSIKLAGYQKRLADIEAESKEKAGTIGSRIAQALNTGFTKGMSFVWKGVRWVLNGIWNGAKSAISGLRSARHETKSLGDMATQVYRKFTTYLTMLRTRIRRRAVSTMFNDMKADFGQMADISPSFNNAVSGMANSMKMLGAQILAAAEPFITTFGPIISQVIDWLAKGADSVSQFTARLTGSDTYFRASKGNYDFAKSMKESDTNAKKATKSVKEYKNTVLGFDQLNKLNGEDSSSSSTDLLSGITGAKLDKAKTDATELNKIADSVWDAFKRHDFKSAGKGLADAVNYGFGWLKDTVGWEKNGERLTGIINGFNDTVNGFTEGFDAKAAGSAIADTLNTVINSFDLLTSGLDFKQAGLKIGETLATAFADTDWSTAGSALMKGIQGIAKFITGIITAPDFGKNIGTAFREAFHSATEEFDTETWSDLIAGVVNTISDILVEAFANEDDFTTFGEKVGDSITKAFEKINTDQLKLGVKSAFKGIANIIKGVMSAGDWAEVGSVISELLFSEDGITSSLLSSLFEAGLALGKGILTGLIPGMADNLGQNIAKMSSKAYGDAVGLITGDKSFANQWNAAVSGDIEKLREAIINDGKLNIAAFKAIAKMGGGEFESPFDEALLELYEGMDPQKVYEILKPYNEAYAQETYLALTEQWDKLGEFIHEHGDVVPGIVKGIIENADAEAITGIKAGMSGITTTIENGKPTVTEAVNGLSSVLDKALSDINSDSKLRNWVTIGGNIVRGLINGLNNERPSLTSTISSIATSIVSVFSSDMKINSPSKVMADLGEFIPAGIAMGIDANADAIVSSMDELGSMTTKTASNMTDGYGGDGGALTGAIVDGMRQAVMEAVMLNDSNDNGVDGDIVLVVDSEELARASLRGQRRIDKRTSPTVSFA